MSEDQFPFGDIYDWTKKECIGSGGFAKVYKVKNIKTGQLVAIKQIDMNKFDEDFKKQALMNEINVMKELKSLNTVCMIECKLGKVYTYLVLQLCDRDLKKTLLQSNCLEETQAIKIIIDIVQGFKFLVQKGYIHRDLKPQNVLEKSKIHKLADYGFTKKVEIDVEKLKEVCGTPLYMAPQLLYCKQYTSKCDIWSLGLILYEMIFGYLPWPTRYIQTYKQGVVSHEVSFPYNCEIGKNTKSFIQNCLKLQQSQRMTWKQVFQSPLITTKKAGPPIIHTKVTPQLQKILIRVQQSSSRKCINMKQLFNNHSKNSQMNQKQFNNFLISIDPQITSYQSQQIFIASDFSRDGYVNLHEFKQFFLEIDYRPYKDIGSRRIEQIAKMAQSRNLNVFQFFQIFDQDHSNEIDYQEFSNFIHYIAPKINNKQINTMWNIFDKDQSGTINLQQFQNQITKGTKIYTQQHFHNYERAKRNVECLKNYLISRSITPSIFIAKAANQNTTINLNDFANIVKSINYTISKEQIIQMFKLIDENNSQQIDYLEIQKFLTK